MLSSSAVSSLCFGEAKALLGEGSGLLDSAEVLELGFVVVAAGASLMPISNV